MTQINNNTTAPNPLNDNERITTALLFFVLLIAFFITSYWIRGIFILYIVFVAVIISVELTKALKNRFRPLYYAPVILTSLSMLAPLYTWFQYRDLVDWYLLGKDELPLDVNWTTNFIWLLAYGVLMYAITYIALAALNVVIRLITKGPDHLPHAVAENSIGLYISAAFVTVVLFTFAVPNGAMWLIFALLTPMIVDVAAYAIGNYFGTKKILPKLSPAKSWQGFWAGMFAGVVFGTLYFMILFSGETPLLSLGKASIFGALAGLVMALTSQFGDWFASGIKRWCQQKDFGNVLPGHGGFLDRFDSIMFSLPTSLVLALVFYLLKR